MLGELFGLFYHAGGGLTTSAEWIIINPMPTPAETLTPRERGLRQFINGLSRAIKAGEEIPKGGKWFDAAQTSTERLFVATINDVLENGGQSSFSGASDDFVEIE